MNPKSFFRYLPSALAFGMALASQAHADNPANLDQRLDVNEDPRQLVYGEAMYDFYLGNGFKALNDMLVAKASNIFTDDDDDSEVFIGDRYTQFGLPQQADAIFSKSINRNTLSTTRNSVWLRKGRLQYQLGNYAEAKKILSANQDNLTGELDYERRIMLANVLMQGGDFSGARHVLEPIPTNTLLGAYASYNIGVAYLRANRSSEGVRLLQSVMNLPVSDNTTNALKDRAALAIGYNFLQQKQPDKARDALINIRLDGPFTNKALLALGYAHYQHGDYKKALSFWLELRKRNPADPAVQEAMMLAPRAYEEMSANEDALFGYRLASTDYRSQLKALERTSQSIDQPNWLEDLNPSSDAGLIADPLATVDTSAASNGQEVSFLFELFASNDFNEAYKQYVQLKRLADLMNHRADELKALSDVSKDLQQRSAQIAGAQVKLEKMQKRYTDLQTRWTALQQRASNAGNDASNFADTASVADVEREHKLDAMAASIEQLPDSAQKRELRERLERVRGLSLWAEATNAPMSQDDLYQSLQDTDTQMQTLQVRLKAAEALLADNQKVLKSQSEARITQLSARVTTAQADLQKELDTYRSYLRESAHRKLAEIKARLNNDLAESYLSVARLQDQAVSRDTKQASATGGTQP